MKSRQCCTVSLFVENHKVHTEESRSVTIYYIQSLILRSLEGQKYQGIYILEYPSTLCLIVRCIHWSIVATIHTSYDNMDKNAFPRTSETLGSVDNHHTEQDISIDFVSIRTSSRVKADETHRQGQHIISRGSTVQTTQVGPPSDRPSSCAFLTGSLTCLRCATNRSQSSAA